MNRVNRIVLAGVLSAMLPALAGAAELWLLPLSYYFLDGTRTNGDSASPVVSPSSSSMLQFGSGRSYTFTALPPKGHKTDGWRLSTQTAIASARSLQFLSSIDEYEGDTAAVEWRTKYSGGSNMYFYLTPCFSWLNWTLAYKGNYSGVAGDYGLADLVYTNSVTLADPADLWNATRTGYDIEGWSLTSTGAVQFAVGETLANAGEALDVAADGDKVYLYAVWKKRAMQISLDAQGGSVASNSITAYIGETYSLPTPERQGFDFINWSVAPSGGTTISNGATVSRDDISRLYAQWRLISYSLSYNWDWTDAGAAPTTQNYGYTNTITTVPAPATWKRTGYDFIGWSTSPASETAQFAPGKVLSMSGSPLGVTRDGQAVTLYGVWRKRAMTISLDAQGGGVSTNSVTVKIDGSYALPVPVREGFVFDGWYTSASGGTLVSTGDKVVKDDIAALYAHWTLVEFTLSCDWNWAGAGGAPDDVETGYTNTVTLATAPAVRRVGYDFLGWSPSKTATSAAYAPGASLANAGKILGVTGQGQEVKLYGVWERRTMTIALDAQGGESAESSIAAMVGEKYPALPVPAREGFIFLGWFTEAEGGVQISGGDDVEVDDIETLYARWRLIAFTLAYDENFGLEPEREYVECGWTNAISISALPAGWTRTGWDCLGWALDGSATDVDFAIGQEIPIAGETFEVVDGGTNDLYAVWEKRRMEISLDPNGGETPVSGIVAYIDEAYDGLPVLTRRDAWFRGWWTDDGEEITNGMQAARDDITTLYAHWEAKAVYGVIVIYTDAVGVVTTNDAISVYDQDPVELSGLDVVDLWTGHTFDGWDVDAADLACVASNLTVTALYHTNEYDVKFYANGGQGAMMPSQHFIYGEEKNLTANTYRRGKTEAWHFAGWARDEDATEAEFVDGQSVASLTAEDNGVVDLNAVWASSLTAYSTALGTQVVLEPDSEGAQYWTASTGSEVVGEDEVEFGVVVMCGGVWAGKTTLSGKVFGKGVFSFRWKADYSYLYDVMEFKIDGTTAYSHVMQDGEWMSCSTEISEGWHEIAWVLPFIGDEHHFYIRDVSWKPDGEFEVSFDPNGGEGEMAPETFYQGEYGTLPRSRFTLAGWTFTGWLDDEGHEFSDRECTSMLTADTTLSARWRPNEYAIHFDANGGEGTMADMQLYYDSQASLTANGFTRTGYTFAGWLWNGATWQDGAEVLNLTDVDGDELDFVAQWNANRYSVEFDANGGEGEMAPQPFVYDVSAKLSPNVFTLKGYSFAGWKLGDDVLADEAEVGNLTAEDGGAVTLSAVWTPVGYTIAFDGGSAAGEMESITLAYDEELKLPANAFARTGYSFVGWEYGDSLFADCATVSNLTDVANATVALAARWTAHRYTVKFDANGGEGAMDPQPFTYDAAAALAENAFTRKGYLFAGWTLGCEVLADGKEVGNLTAEDGGEVTLSAVWKPVEYTLELRDDGSAPVTLSLVYDNEAELPPNEFARTGYTFAGWTFGSETFADCAAVKNLADEDGAVVVFTAKWQPVSYTVEFSANGGTGAMDDAALTYGETASLAANSFTRLGYKFKGWALDDAADAEVAYADGADILNVAAEAGAVATLYAVWEPVGYSVRFDANGGTGVMDDLAMTYDAAANLPKCAFARDAHAFAGWNFNGVAYADGAEVLNLASVDGDVLVFSAMWDEVEVPEPEPGPDDIDILVVPEVFPEGAEETSDFTAGTAATYNGWLRDKDTSRMVALLSVKTSAVRKEGAESRVTITVTPLEGKKRTFKTSVAPGGNPTDEYGIVYGGLGLSGEFDGYAVEAAQDFSKAKANTPERSLVDFMPLGVWTVAFEDGDGHAVFSVTVSKKGKAKVSGYLADGTKVSASAQGILGAGNLFAVPVMNAKKGFGFVLWIDEDGAAAVSDCADPSWTLAASGERQNISDGYRSLDFSMPDWRDYITATEVDAVNVTPIDAESLSVAGGKWKAVKTVGRLAIDKTYSPARTYVKHSATQTPANLAALKMTYSAKTGIATGSFKLWHVHDGRLRSDKATISGVVVNGGFCGTATVKKLGGFKVFIND